MIPNKTAPPVARRLTERPAAPPPLPVVGEGDEVSEDRTLLREDTRLLMEEEREEMPEEMLEMTEDKLEAPEEMEETVLQRACWYSTAASS